MISITEATEPSLRALAMACSTSAFFPSFSSPSSPADPLKQHLSSIPHTCLLFNSHSHQHKRQSLSLQAALASSFPLPINVDYMEREFSNNGVSFEGIGDGCVVKLRLDNGSAVTLMLPSGLITSYKPRMWHGTTVEVLHTIVSEGEEGEAVVQGGVSVDLKCAREGGLPWSPSNWALNDIRGGSDKSIQVELISINPEDMVEVKCLLSLHEDFLGSELTISNPKPTPLQLLGSVISHLTVSTPDATFMFGLQGSNYRNKPPATSEFSIIPPDFSKERSTDSSRSWVPRALQGLFFPGDSRDEKADQSISEGEETGGEEENDSSQMTEKMSRIYTSAPREFTLIDRGRRNSLVMRRGGFEEFYVFSPGSNHEWYGRYAYICIGPSATLEPIVLGPGDVWNGAQYLYNPSL